jgi:hypothetical protein
MTAPDRSELSARRLVNERPGVPSGAAPAAGVVRRAGQADAPEDVVDESEPTPPVEDAGDAEPLVQSASLEVEGIKLGGAGQSEGTVEALRQRLERSSEYLAAPLAIATQSRTSTISPTVYWRLGVLAGLVVVVIGLRWAVAMRAARKH